MKLRRFLPQSSPGFVGVSLTFHVFSVYCLFRLKFNSLQLSPVSVDSCLCRHFLSYTASDDKDSRREGQEAAKTRDDKDRRRRQRQETTTKTGDDDKDRRRRQRQETTTGDDDKDRN